MVLESILNPHLSPKKLLFSQGTGRGGLLVPFTAGDLDPRQGWKGMRQILSTHLGCMDRLA